MLKDGAVLMVSIERLATHPTLLFTGTIPFPALVSENVQKFEAL